MSRTDTIYANLQASVTECAALSAQIGAQSAALQNSLAVSIDTCKAFRLECLDALALAAEIATVAEASASAAAFRQKVGRLSRVAQAQSDAMRTIYNSMTLATNGSAAMDAVKRALINTNALTMQASSTINDMSDLIKRMVV